MSQTVGIAMTAITAAPFVTLWLMWQARWDEYRSYQEALDKLWKEMRESREAMRLVGNIPEILDRYIDINHNLWEAGKQQSARSRKKVLEDCRQQVEAFRQCVIALKPTAQD